MLRRVDGGEGREGVEGEGKESSEEDHCDGKVEHHINLTNPDGAASGKDVKEAKTPQ